VAEVTFDAIDVDGGPLGERAGNVWDAIDPALARVAYGAAVVDAVDTWTRHLVAEEICRRGLHIDGNRGKLLT
jgi:hypothetical protein